mgnify:CR=1 FL=1
MRESWPLPWPSPGFPYCVTFTQSDPYIGTKAIRSLDHKGEIEGAHDGHLRLLAELAPPPTRPSPSPSPAPLQAFKRLLQQGCRTDHVVFAAITDVLWDSGTASAQARAARIYRAAVGSGAIKPVTAAPPAAAGSSTATTSTAGTTSNNSSGAVPQALMALALSGGAAPPPGAASGGSATGSATAATGSTAGGCLEPLQEVHLGAVASGSSVAAFFCFLAEQR